MDNHQASILSGTLAGHTEAVRFHLPEQVRAMTDAAQRTERAVEEFTRQVDRMEDLMRNPPTPSEPVALCGWDKGDEDANLSPGEVCFGLLSDHEDGGVYASAAYRHPFTPGARDE